MSFQTRKTLNIFRMKSESSLPPHRQKHVWHVPRHRSVVRTLVKQSISVSTSILQSCKSTFCAQRKKKHFISWGDTRVINKLHNLDFWVNYPSCYYSTLTIFTCAQIMWLYESKDLFWVMTQANLFTPVYMRLLLLWLFAIVVIFTEPQCTAYIVCCNAMSQYFDCIFDQLDAALVRFI